MGVDTSNVVPHDVEELIMQSIVDNTDMPTCELNTRKELLLGAIYERFKESGSAGNTSANNSYGYLRPEDFGAKGDNVANDSDAFSPNKKYYLEDGKTYFISMAKMNELVNTCYFAGGGKLRCEPHRGWSRPSGYNNAFYEYPCQTPKNEIEACYAWWSNDSSTDDLEKRERYHMQGLYTPVGHYGKYHNIAAIYINHNFVQDTGREIPEQFTICIGRNCTWQRDTATNTWKKTSDMYGVDGLENYRIPWTGNYNRKFDNIDSAVFIDNHYELVVNTEELLNWKGTDEAPAETGYEAVIHFWGRKNEFALYEIDHLISSWVVWVKEPEAEDLLVMTTGIDLYDVDGVNGIKQAYSDGGRLIKTYPIQTWGATMNPAELKALCDTDAILTEYYADSYIEHTETGGKNFNLLGFNDFSLQSSFKNANDETVTTTLNCVGDKLTITCTAPDDELTTRTSFSLLRYLKNKNLKAGIYNLGFEFLEGDVRWFGYFRPNVNLASERVDIKPLNTLHRVFHTTFELSTDLSDFLLLTPAITEITIRLWITKGEDSREYQPFGEDVAGLRLRDNITVPDITDIQSLVHVTEEELTAALSEVYDD